MLEMYEQYDHAGVRESQQLIQPLLKHVGVIESLIVAETERERRGRKLST